jgi:hypothetical protein
MLGEVILLCANMVGVVEHLAHDGEEDGGMAFPVGRIPLPEIFVLTRAERHGLGSPMGDGERQVVVGYLHGIVSFVFEIANIHKKTDL